MSREENVAIFEDTRRICKTNPTISSAIKLSNEHQEIILENDVVKPTPKVYANPAKVIVN